ncbi:MAG: hypothetical protein HY878_03915 [Deltaproteobacteria bacterium]|nr:hypothetical protein [Deltaproteobacteria bacterium]
MEKNLAELEKHPAMLRRCQEFYLERIINKTTYEELSKRHGVALATAWKYVEAYRKVADRYADNSNIQDVVAFCHSEIAQLLQWREEVKTSQERQMFTKEVRAYQAMIWEVTGLTDRRPQVYINNVVNEMVIIIDQEVREALREVLGLSKEKAAEVLRVASEGIKRRVDKTGVLETSEGVGYARPR